MMLTLGSLFDGIGGFPLAGAMCGIRPVWSSEIEPFPLKVTAARFPGVIQLGSVTDIDGGAVKPVDIITFGSPCQDLSVAGKQLGIHEGQRSNLFFEAVRIIKEMRAADGRIGRTGQHIRPRFAVWENVPGAFSSNKGADFKAVLEALAGVCEDEVDVPQPKKWNIGGGILGNGWSIAWRVYDAQYWGVPQRRKRIYLVADFAGERAPEILFECESVRGDIAAGGEAGEGAAADAEGGVGGGGGVGIAAFMGGQGAKARSIAYYEDGTTPTLRAAPSGGNQVPDVCYPAIAFTERGRDGGRSCETQDGVFYALTNPGDGGRSQSRMVCYAIQGNGILRADTAGCNGSGWRTDQMYTLNTIDRPAVCFQQNQRDEVRNMGKQAGALTAQPGVHNQNYLCYPETARALTARHDSSPCVDRGQNVVALAWANSGNAGLSEGDVAPTIKAARNGEPAIMAFCAGGGKAREYDGHYGNISPTIRANAANTKPAVCVGNGQLHQTDMGDKTGALNCMHDQQAVIHAAEPPRKYIVRRLTPTECARLHGFPDDWCEGLGGSDSAIYKAYGNGLALPCAYDVMNRIARFVEHEKEDQQ